MKTPMTTTTHSRRLFVSLAAAAFLFALAPAGARADRESDLQERFKRRLAELRDARAAGTIGETYGGFVEAVEGKSLDGKLKGLVEEENADRRELYKLIAEKEKATEEKVAERAGARNFQKARSGEYLKDKDGKWKRKK
jgi:uncharacterized protein YdbL (DUF1318 family)